MSTVDTYGLPTMTWENQPWREHAACKGVDLSTFFGDSAAMSKVAISICRTCPSQRECLEWAVANNFEDGVFGGFAAKDRRHVAKGGTRWQICGSVEGIVMHNELGEELCPACTSRQRTKELQSAARIRSRERKQ